MSLTQKTLRAPIQGLIDNQAWGDVKSFDIVVTRKGTKLDDTEYSIIPNPKTELAPEIAEKFEESNIDLQVWFRGDDPFEVKDTSTTRE